MGFVLARSPRRSRFAPQRAAAFLLLTALVFFAPSVSSAPLTNRQIAQLLFDQARELMARKDYAKACPMLAESQRLDAGGGTLLNLALCYEGEGKLATAQLELNEALAQAIQDGRSDREAIAREHLAQLAPRVPKLTLVAPAASTAGLSVALDGVPLNLATLGLPLPLDPGAHEVRADAPGRVSWVSIDDLREGEYRTVQVPSLAVVGAGPERAPESSSHRTPTFEYAPSPKKKIATASWVLGGVGAGAFTASLVVGAFALDAKSEFETRCFAERSFCANASDADFAASARNLAWASTGLLATAAIAGAAAIFWPRTVVAQTSGSRAHTVSFEF